MHDIRWIRENEAAFDRALARRNADEFKGKAAFLIDLDDARKSAIAAAQDAQTLRNALSKQIGQAMAARDVAKADSLKAQVNALKESARLNARPRRRSTRLWPNCPTCRRTMCHREATSMAMSNTAAMA